jgi:hypothetical protein
LLPAYITPHSNFQIGEELPLEIGQGMIVSESVVSLLESEVSPTVPETTVQLTEKAKKARKRRGTFENDNVVTAAKEPAATAMVGVAA